MEVIKIRNLLIGAVLFVLLFLILHFLGIKYFVIFNGIEWLTKFILPWIFLYWLVRMIKFFEKKKQ